jgi:hypothetical protein
MKYLSLIIVFITLFICRASAQDIPKMDINIGTAKCIELKEIPDHIGDTVCIYGHVRNFKMVSDQNIIIAQIDSASNNQPVIVEIAYVYAEAKPYLVKQLKNNMIIIFGIITGTHDKPKVVSKVFMPDDKSGTWLSYFKSKNEIQRDTSKLSKVRITDVQLLPPGPASIKNFFSTHINKKIQYCDLVSGGKISDHGSLTELYLNDSTLVILIKDKVMDKFKVAPQTAFLNKQVCVKGTLMAYQGKFAINIIDPEQIEILPDH